jgi:hypothetical protein
MSRISNPYLQIAGIFFLILFMANEAVGQNRIAVYGSRSYSIKNMIGSSPGYAPEGIKDDSRWLNYTILMKEQETHYSITAQLMAGEIPKGTIIRLRAGSYVGPGEGKTGIPTGEIQLSETPQIIIDQIGTSHTGNGLNVGHQLFYTIDILDFSKFEEISSSIHILFTITQ